MSLYDDNRPWRGLYKLARWRKLRARKLTSDPLCVYCFQRSVFVPATVVDHVTPHRGVERLFWDAGNLQSLCKACHDGRKQRDERSADRMNAVGLDGYPTTGDW